MTTIWKSIGAIAVSLVFLFLVGYLEIRAEMNKQGLTMTWDLKPLQVTTHTVAVVELVLLFVLFGAVAFLFLTRRRGLSDQRGIPALAGGLTLVAFAGWYMVTVDYRVQVPTELNETGLEFGWSDILENAGLSTMTHSMAALLLVITLLQFTEYRSNQNPPPTDVSSGRVE